ncbi:MAG: hypothetical protein MZW92_81275 [Comamonadaceae bacterium]|nr:hypothetical protein [Comamonadaceae bacterium]
MTPAGFAWGQVWEWTASRFLPYPGFVAHPYRDYSAPWFGDRYVLRGVKPRNLAAHGASALPQFLPAGTQRPS